jgi:hypothetical protein
LQSALEPATRDIDPRGYAAHYPEAHLRSAEESFYHKLLKDAFDHPEVILKNVGRWAQWEI